MALFTTPSPARTAVRLEVLSVLAAAWEAVGAAVVGATAGSLALLAFGADSLIEMASALIVLGEARSLVHARPRHPRAQHRAHRLVAVLFFALALYVVVSALVALLSRYHPHENAWGVGVALASSLAMPALALAKRRAARATANDGHAALARLLVADAAETALCATLAVATLAGVVLAWWHWWWADPAASLAVVYFALREGREAWECAAQ